MEGNYLTRNSHKGESFGFEEHTWGTSWPARNYACSFCKREFKSAQALGGHMNVHRRDRARLRSSLSTWVSHDQCTTPKPNPSSTKANPTQNNLSSLPSSTSSTSSYLSNALLNCAHRSPLYCPCLTLSSSSSLPPASTSGDKKPRLSSFQIPPLCPQNMEINMTKETTSGLGVEGLHGCEMLEDDHKVLEDSYNEHNITLELGIGLLEHPKEKLDLELRLGNF